MSRPTLLTDELKDRLVQAAEVIYHYKWTAKSCGIGEDTFKDYRNQDKDLADRVEEARARFIKTHMKRAKADFILQTSDRETFGLKQEIAITGDIKEAILEGFGIEIRRQDDRKTDEPVDSSSQKPA